MLKTQFYIIYSIRKNCKFTCSKYESLWLEISVENNNNNSKIILVGITYKHPGYYIHEFNKKYSGFLLKT